MEWSSPDIQPAKVFYLVNKNLEGKATLYSYTVAQAIANLPATKDPEETTRKRARLAVEAIASFNAHTLDDKGPTTSYDSSEYARGQFIYRM